MHLLEVFVAECHRCGLRDAAEVDATEPAQEGIPSVRDPGSFCHNLRASSNQTHGAPVVRGGHLPQVLVDVLR